ncbi:MAG: hypothetical protein MI922_25475 [Bacteroidales bacterium]|nr:hypothetical protein [Bacteroidales bacterium]
MKTERKTKLTIGIVVTIALAIVIAIVATVRIGQLGQSGSGLGSAYQVDLSEMARVDPNLLLYEPVGDAWSTTFQQSQALAVDGQGRLHIAGDRAIKVFQAQQVVSTVELTVEPRSLVVLKDRYFVGTTDQVVEVSLHGEVIKAWPAVSESSLITALAVDDEFVFIADAKQRIVWCYDRDGNLLRRIGDRDPQRKILGFNIPSPYFDLSLAPAGRLCVVNPGNHRIETYTVDGDLETWWGSFGTTIDTFTGCCNPTGITILADGRFVTAEKGLARVKLYQADGTFAGVVAGPNQLVEGQPVICETPEQCQSGGFKVAADRAGRLYLLDTAKNLIRVYVEKKV